MANQQTVVKNAIDDDSDLNLDLGLFNAHINAAPQDHLKRKASAPDGVVLRNECEEGASERRRKVVSSALESSFQGHNGSFGGIDGEIRSSVSIGSSDSYLSNSNITGENSSDTSSHSSHSRVHLSAAPTPAPTPTSDPCGNQSVLSQEETRPTYSNHTQSSRNVTSTEINPQAHKIQSNSNKRALDKGSNPIPRSSSHKVPKVVLGKPPKPKRQMSQQSVLLPQMPCVSTNGPNGKTITGFLYKYSKTEVSIICMCHGTSFSPAGFVEHAGGVDVEHPLKHIRVVPFALR